MFAYVPLVRTGRTALALVALFALLAGAMPVAAGAQAQSSAVMPAADPLQGDGRVSNFYTWDGLIPRKPGLMLRVEALPAPLGLAKAGEQRRVLYTSTSGVDGTSPTVVSGTLFEPTGAPPPGGWPLIAWAHGTVGVADICAPSWSVRSYRDIAYLNTWLAQGYAVVSTDYAGLGTPGGHPYLNTRVEAYSVLDSIRAALAQDTRIANKTVIVGQSQGGGAAYATAAYAKAYAPEIDIRGTVATGVPYFGPNVASAGAPDPTKVDPGIAYIFYIVLMAQQTERTLDAATVFTPAALPLFEVARSACIDPLEDDVTLAKLTDATALRPALSTLFAQHIKEFEYPTLALPQPIFIGTGLADSDVRPVVQEQLVKDSCAAGTVVEAHQYRGLTHSETVNASLKDSLPFVQNVLSGKPIKAVCTPVPQ